MTTIRTTCPECGEVDMTPEAIVLTVQPSAGEGAYRFDCPSCGEAVQKPADRKIVALLVSAGVAVDAQGAESAEEEEFVEAGEPLGDRATGPSFTHDDLIDFHYALQDDEYLERFLTSA